MSAPLAWLGVLAATDGLGANPIEFVTRYLGDWALRALLAALAPTALNILFGWTGAVRLRRMVGLYAFAYAVLHVSSYVVLDQFFDWAAIWADVIKRKYITAGMATVAILSLLAATSWAGAVRRLGAKTWKRLHRGVYAAALLACLHYAWMVKADLTGPALHAAVLAVLLGVRMAAFTKKRLTPLRPR
ncbi:MAG: sulfoxide reductase heme-binding subunit YedZ [Alphaproteobacteria bacterium]|nr:sulfoxide reductase heme-binding subunit YedZ [Alphaproteobacteria bacterium]